MPITFLAIGVAVFLAIIGVQTVRLSNCKAENAEIVAKHQILVAKTEEQNAKVNELEAQSRQAKEKGRKALQKAKDSIRTIEADRDRLEAELAARGPKTASGVTSCVDIQKAVASVRAGLK